MSLPKHPRGMFTMIWHKRHRLQHQHHSSQAHKLQQRQPALATWKQTRAIRTNLVMALLLQPAVHQQLHPPVALLAHPASHLGALSPTAWQQHASLKRQRAKASGAWGCVSAAYQTSRRHGCKLSSRRSSEQASGWRRRHGDVPISAMRAPCGAACLCMLVSRRCTDQGALPCFLPLACVGAGPACFAAAACGACGLLASWSACTRHGLVRP